MATKRSVQYDRVTIAPRAGSRASINRPIRIGISTCLLGERVRFDGGHKRDAFLVETLGRYVDFVPVCPEVEAGLGIPRESMHLRRDRNGVRLVTALTHVDLTELMHRFAAARVAALAHQDLCGYVLKQSSPSCGMERVKIYGARGHVVAAGPGLFAQALRKALPHLPVEDEGRLRDPHARESFIERVFAYRRLRALFAAHWTISGLVAFHSAHKLQLKVHSPRAHGELSRLVSGAKALDRATLRARYEAKFMAALAVIATSKRRVSVLRQVLRCLSARLAAPERRELAALIDEYGGGWLPLAAPLALFRNYVRQFDLRELAAQTYLNPDPQELLLIAAVN